MRALGASGQPGAGALCNFWRSCENLTVLAPMHWEVSQAAPLRNVSAPSVDFAGAGYSSGGYAAELTVAGPVNFLTQQQFYVRNSKYASANGGGMNAVLQGNRGTPAGGGKQTALARTPVIAEKPFITFEDEEYKLVIPPVQPGKQGPSAPDDVRTWRRVSFTEVFVATRGTEKVFKVAMVNQKLSEGRHVVFAPGFYELDASIKVVHDGQVLLALGIATFVAPEDGSPAIQVQSGLTDVRLCAMFLQACRKAAGSMPGALLQWGDKPSKASYKAKPNGFAYDLFARVGGDNDVIRDSEVIDGQECAIATRQSSNIFCFETQIRSFFVAT